MKSTIFYRIIILIISSITFLGLNAANHILNQTSGTISVTGSSYTDNMDESWEINTGENKPVFINFTIDIEDGFDYVVIFNVDAAGALSGTPAAVLTGAQTGIRSTTLPTGRAKVFFSSDGSASNDDGFMGISLTFKPDNSIGYTDNLYVNGYLGVGTSTPLERLHVNGSVRGNAAGGTLRVKSEYGYLDLGPQNGAFAHIYTDRPSIAINKKLNLITGELTSYSNTNLYLQTGSGNTRMTILNSNGNVGIGTTPSCMLDVNGKLRVRNADIYGYNVLTFQDDARFTVAKADVPSLTASSFSMPQYGIAAPNTTGSADLWISGNNGIRMFTAGIPAPRLSITRDGKVGIGTAEADNTPGVLLTVKGSIHAKEVLIDLNAPLADYVFDSNYKLMPLHKVEEFVNANNHLPEMPSAAEVGRNGLSLGEMQNKLLQKVEELTLYSIQQQKQIQALQQEINELKSKK